MFFNRPTLHNWALNQICSLTFDSSNIYNFYVKIHTKENVLTLYSTCIQWLNNSSVHGPIPEFEVTLWCDDLSKLPIWLRQLERLSVSCPRTTMGTLLEGLDGKTVGVQWQLGDFSHVKGSSRPIEKHTTTNKEHPWPDNEALWVWSF